MTTRTMPAFGPSAKDFDARASAASAIATVGDLLPLAHELGLVSNVSLESLLDGAPLELRRLTSNAGKAAAFGYLRDAARLGMAALHLVRGSAALQDLIASKHVPAELDLSLDALSIARQAESSASFAAGYIAALDDVRSRTIGRGAQGKKMLGEANRRKVREAAFEAGHLSKTKAAIAIANLIHLEPDTVRKILAAEFPEKAWPPSKA